VRKLIFDIYRGGLNEPAAAKSHLTQSQHTSPIGKRGGEKGKLKLDGSGNSFGEQDVEQFILVCARTPIKKGMNPPNKINKIREKESSGVPSWPKTK